MKVFSTGEVANLLGIHRDKVQTFLLNEKSPKPSMKIGNRKAWTEKDVTKFYEWLDGKGVAVKTPDFLAAAQ